MARMISLFTAVVSLALTILFALSFFMDWPSIPSMMMKIVFLVGALVMTVLSASLLRQK